MKFADHLSKKDIQKFNQLRRAADKEHKAKRKDNHPVTQPKPKKKDERINWSEIMGMNRDIYTRRNGAVRRK